MQATVAPSRQGGWLALLQQTDVALALVVLLIIVMMVVPMPTTLLDLLIALNISVGVTILLVSIYAKEPLDFSVFPTLLHFAGCPEPSGASGFGRVLIRENRVAPGPRAVVVEEYRSRALAQGASCSGYRRRLLRTNRFRFVWRSDEVNELYDLMVDPVGQRDLALERPELAAAMRVHLFEWLAFHHGSRQGAMTPDVQQIQQSALRVVL